MSGIHVFPDKDQALAQIVRVLKPGGFFTANFYVRGISRLTDMWVTNFLGRMGWLTPPFYTQEDARRTLSRLFSSGEYRLDVSMMTVRCWK